MQRERFEVEGAAVLAFAYWTEDHHFAVTVLDNQYQTTAQGFGFSDKVGQVIIFNEYILHNLITFIFEWVINVQCSSIYEPNQS